MLPVGGVRDLGAALAGGPDRAPRPRPGDTALLAYTSGTTGRPKGVPLTHAELAISIRSVMAAWRWTADDVLVHALPLFHQHGLGGVHATLIAGSSAHLLSRFSAAWLIAAVADAGASVLLGVPSIYQALADAVPEGTTGAEALRRLRLAVCGSAPLNRDSRCADDPAISVAWTPPRPCWWNSGSACTSTSSAVQRHAAITERMEIASSACVSGTPFGRPVVPDVYASSAVSPGRGRGARSGRRARAAPRSRTPTTGSIRPSRSAGPGSANASLAPESDTRCRNSAAVPAGLARTTTAPTRNTPR